MYVTLSSLLMEISAICETTLPCH